MSKFITIIITIVLAISLTACGGSTPTPVQSTPEPSSSTVSVVEQTSNVESESSEPDSSSESEAGSDSESSSESSSTGGSADSGNSEVWSQEGSSDYAATTLYALTDEQFAEVLYTMPEGVKEEVMDYIVMLSNAIMEETAAYAEGRTENLQFPEILERSFKVIEQADIPSDVSDLLGKLDQDIYADSLVKALEERGYMFVMDMWETSDERFLEMVYEILGM